MKTVTHFLILLLTGLLLAGCGSGADEEDTVTLSLWNRYMAYDPALNEFVERFEDEHPGIEIDVDHLPDADPAYQTAVSEGQMPDMFMLGVYQLYEFVELGVAKNLDELFPDEVRDQYRPGTWEENVRTYEDSVYALPFISPNHGAYMMYYNTEVMEELGISEDEIPETWDELVEMGHRVYEESDGDTYGFMWSSTEFTNSAFVRLQSTVFNPEVFGNFNFQEGRPDFANEGNIEAIEFLNTMLEDNVMYPGSLNIDSYEAGAHFAAGQAAFYIGGNFAGATIREDGFENFGVTEMPTADGTPFYHAPAQEHDGLMVNEDTEHWEEVQIFLEYGMENLESEVIIPVGSTQPAKEDVEGESFSQYTDISRIMDEQAVVIPNPAERSLDTIAFDVAYNNRISQYAMGNIAVGYMAGEIDDIETFLQEVDEEANEHFDELMEEFEDVDPEWYQFPNWEPHTPYEEEDYEELDD